MGFSYSDKKGNSISIQDNGLINITPKGESTRFYTVKELIQLINIAKTLEQNSK